tara:strand:- start:71 stop:1789 length:1719 start_codon:yes stop_codon:yes gene_type:complete
MLDLVIRDAKIVDGSGRPSFHGDVGVLGDKIVFVGAKAARGKQEVNAEGRLLLPGWVDVHTHYDGQATWDEYLTPSCWHGVTTAIMGNCGVGFAPAYPDKREWLIGLMEGVEDIPGTALSEGIQWEWESFPEYLNALEAKPRVMNLAAQIPHGPVRAYVMGEAGAQNVAASDEQMLRMAAIVREAIQEGALGFSTSRTVLHRSIDGELVPGTKADAAELITIAKAMGDVGNPVFEVASDLAPESKELGWMEDILSTGCKITYACVQNDFDPEQWRRLLLHAKRFPGKIFPQVAIRPPGVLMCLEGTHPFSGRKTYAELHKLPLSERMNQLKSPEIKRKILSEAGTEASSLLRLLFIEGKEISSKITDYDRIFTLNNPPEYEPESSSSVGALATIAGCDVEEMAYDLLLEDEGRAFLYSPLFNYASGNYDDARTMMLDEHTVVGISDGGAHCGMICDASAPTYLLQHFVRDRTRGPRIGLEQAVKLQTYDTASLYGLFDRGLIQEGQRADLNLVDFDKLELTAPEMVDDLPASGKRLIQRAEGYEATFVGGKMTFNNGEVTGTLPGKLVRGKT